jgi:hypothetical protein
MREKIVRLKIAELVFDFDFYPRRKIDTKHVSDMVEASHAGVEFPPIVIDAKSKRIVDGFHRGRMYERLFGPEFEVECIARFYDDDAQMFRQAMLLNAKHGKDMDSADRAHCISLGERLGLKLEQIAESLCMTVDKVGELKTCRIGEMRVAGQRQDVPLKRTIEHKAGMVLTKAQVEANNRLGGMKQVFYVNQVITLIESDLLDVSDEKLLQRLGVLHGLIGELLGGG